MLTPAQKPRGFASMIFIATESPESLAPEAPIVCVSRSGEKARRPERLDPMPGPGMRCRLKQVVSL